MSSPHKQRMTRSHRRLNEHPRTPANSLSPPGLTQQQGLQVAPNFTPLQPAHPTFAQQDPVPISYGSRSSVEFDIDVEMFQRMDIDADQDPSNQVQQNRGQSPPYFVLPHLALSPSSSRTSVLRSSSSSSNLQSSVSRTVVDPSRPVLGKAAFSNNVGHWGFSSPPLASALATAASAPDPVPGQGHHPKGARPFSFQSLKYPRFDQQQQGATPRPQGSTSVFSWSNASNTTASSSDSDATPFGTFAFGTDVFAACLYFFPRDDYCNLTCTLYRCSFEPNTRSFPTADHAIDCSIGVRVFSDTIVSSSDTPTPGTVAQPPPVSPPQRGIGLPVLLTPLPAPPATPSDIPITSNNIDTNTVNTIGTTTPTPRRRSIRNAALLLSALQKAEHICQEKSRQQRRRHQLVHTRRRCRPLTDSEMDTDTSDEDRCQRVARPSSRPSSSSSSPSPQHRSRRDRIMTKRAERTWKPRHLLGPERHRRLLNMIGDRIYQTHQTNEQIPFRSYPVEIVTTRRTMTTTTFSGPEPTMSPRTERFLVTGIIPPLTVRSGPMTFEEYLTLVARLDLTCPEGVKRLRKLQVLASAPS
ncbi:hypothetical protein BGX29_001549 [Mortierella sp. GBA35]|nr:hypothetical protein BGX29_001549 [Mortierella sp. GBA35]